MRENLNEKCSELRNFFFFSQCLLLCTVSERVHALRRAPYQNSETGTPVNGSPDKDFKIRAPHWSIPLSAPTKNKAAHALEL